MSKWTQSADRVGRDADSKRGEEMTRFAEHSTFSEARELEHRSLLPWVAAFLFFSSVGSALAMLAAQG